MTTTQTQIEDSPYTTDLRHGDHLRYDLGLHTEKVLYRFFTKEHIEKLWGVKFTQEKWEQFVEDKQDQFAEQMSDEMQESREYYECPLIEKSEYFIDEDA